jgi:gamma-glutamyltranspeptidase/glutathione hydrolase
MTVSHTQSNGPSLGSKLVASGLGFVYATRLGSEPGSRPSSTISPTLVFGPDGALDFALGGAGDSRIITAVVQVISRVVDHGMTLPEAVEARRVHPTGAMALRVEEGPVGRWSSTDQARLRSWGFEVSTAPSTYYGRVHAVAPGPGLPGPGEAALGVAEPRWTGGAAGPR